MTDGRALGYGRRTTSTETRTRPPTQGDAAKGWRDVARPVPLLLASVVAAGATVVQLRSTYDGFLGEAIGSLAAWLLIAFNVVLAIGLMLGLAPLFKPRNVLLYALTIALTWQALIATDLAIEPLGGTEQVGQGQKLNVAFIHTGLEEVLTDSIDDPVEDAKRTEIAGLTERYPAAADLTTLRGDIDANLRTDGSVDDAERESVLTLVDGVIAETEPHHDDKIREIALAVYRGAGRDPIRDLLGTGGTSG